MKERIKKTLFHNEYSYLLAAFFIPFVIMWLIYIAMEVFPFGTNSVLVLDLNGQYVYFFEALRDIIQGKQSLLYSWGRALGGEFMGIFAYYVSSPFSLLVALFPKEMITEALLCIELCKTGACGFAFGFYLHHSHPTKKINIVIFSILYALTAYAVVYQHNTMWMDALIYLPFLLLGLERLIREGKYLLYTISLALLMMAHYYIGYMVCIFTVFYFFYYYYAHNENDENNAYHEKSHLLKSLLRVGVFTVIGLSIALVVIYPAYYSLQFGKTTFTDPSFAFEQKFDFLDMFTKLLPGSYDTVRPEGLPFLYCGMLSLILLPIYFIAPHIKAREKMMGGLILAFLIFSFNGSTIDLIWHGFQKPNWLNYRYSFLFCFMMLVFAYKAFEAIEKIDFRIIVGVCGTIGILLMIIQKQGYKNTPALTCIWVSIACLAFYLPSLHAVNKGYLKSSGTLILAILVCMEMFSAGLLNVTSLDTDVHFSTRTSYRNFMIRYTPIIDKIKENDTSFYRMEKTYHRKTNDAMALGYRGLSNSTSTLNASVIKFLNQMGLSSKSHWAKYLGGTPVSDSLLGLKYLVTEEKEEFENDLYVKKYEAGDIFTYENPYVLPVAYGVNPAYMELDAEKYQSPMEFMNQMVSDMLGRDYIELFKPIPYDVTYENCDVGYTTGHRKYSPSAEGKKAKVLFTLNAVNDNEIFSFFPSDYPREVDLKLNGSDYSTYFGNETDRIVSLGKQKKGEEVLLSMTLTKEDLYLANGVNYFYYLDTALFKEIMPQLNASQMQITDYTESRLTGTIDVKADRTTLFTSIPYDEGWIITIDGKQVENQKAVGALLAAEIPQGQHEIELRYRPKCFTLGLTVSISGVLVLIGIVILETVWKRRKRKILMLQLVTALKKGCNNTR